MKHLLERRVALLLVSAIGAVASIGMYGCGGAGDSESKMTSFTANEGNTDTAELFTVPKDQMRTCRLCLPKKGRYRGLYDCQEQSRTTRLRQHRYSRRLVAQSTKSWWRPDNLFRQGNRY